MEDAGRYVQNEHHAAYKPQNTGEDASYSELQLFECLGCLHGLSTIEKAFTGTGFMHTKMQCVFQKKHNFQTHVHTQTRSRGQDIP